MGAIRAPGRRRMPCQPPRTRVLDVVPALRPGFLEPCHPASHTNRVAWSGTLIALILLIALGRAARIAQLRPVAIAVGPALITAWWHSRSSPAARSEFPGTVDRAGPPCGDVRCTLVCSYRFARFHLDAEASCVEAAGLRGYGRRRGAKGALLIDGPHIAAYRTGSPSPAPGRGLARQHRALLSSYTARRPRLTWGVSLSLRNVETHAPLYYLPVFHGWSRCSAEAPAWHPPHRPPHPSSLGRLGLPGRAAVRALATRVLWSASCASAEWRAAGSGGHRRGTPASFTAVPLRRAPIPPPCPTWKCGCSTMVLITDIAVPFYRIPVVASAVGVFTALLPAVMS